MWRMTMNRSRRGASHSNHREKIYKILACCVALVVLGFGIACDWEWGSSDDDDDGNNEPTPPEEILTLSVSITDSKGEAEAEDLGSDTTITFRVEDESGNPIPDTTVRFMSDGEYFNAMVYNPSGDYLPALYYGTLEDSSWQQAGIGLPGFSQAHAFDPFTITVTLIGVAEETITYDAPSSEGYFDLEDMFDESFTTVCVDKEGLENFSVFRSALESAKAGIVDTPTGGFFFWGANSVLVGTAAETLANKISEDYDPDTEYLVEILTTSDGDFAFFKNTGKTCGGDGWKLYGQRVCTACVLQVWVGGAKVGSIVYRGDRVYLGTYSGTRTVGVYRECDGEVTAVTCSSVNPGPDHDVTAYLDTCTQSSGTGHIEVQGVTQSEVQCE
jgi:hypothetical protein